MTELWAALVKLVAGILTTAASWFAGRSAGQNSAKIEKLKSYAETSKKIDAVGPVSDAAEWLRNRSKH
jgi:hypothetical protein